MSNHLITEANRHAKALLKTTPKMNSKINPDRLALALALEKIDQLERELAAVQSHFDRVNDANDRLTIELAALREDKELLDSGEILITTLGNSVHCRCVNLRKAIRAGIKEAAP